MKKLNNQTGSAHVVIIIILIAVILGLLGFVFWNSFMNKPMTNSTSTTTTQAAPPITTQNTRSLSIKEWGVKGSYTSNSTYGYKIDQYGMLALTDPLLSSSCSSSLGYISRATVSEVPTLTTGDTRTAKEIYDEQTDKTGLAKVGGYYYFALHPQSQCETDAATAVQADITAAELSILASLTQE